MWTPEEKKQWVNELLEFVNNELYIQSGPDSDITREKLDESNTLLELHLGFEELKKNITYQINRRNGAPWNGKFEYDDPKGVTNYISKASIEELQELQDRVEHHMNTLIFYSYSRLTDG